VVLLGSGSIRFKVGGSSYENIASTNGIQEFYFVAATSANNILFAVQSAYTGSIDNVSVREVGQDWDFVGEAELTEQGARILSTSGGQSYINQNALTNTKSYKISYDIVDSTQGSLKLINVNGVSEFPIPSTIGNHTAYFTANNNTLYILRNSGVTDVTITNISVKEVGQNWTLSGVDFSLGSVFFNSDVDYISQTSISFTNGKKYKLTFEGSGNLAYRTGFAGADGTRKQITLPHTAYLTATADTNRIQPYGANGNLEGTLTNISIIEITDDTNLPRINYEGFSFDGSGNIVPNSGCGSWLWEPQSTNLIPYSSDFSSLNIRSNAVVTSNQIISPSGLLDADEITFDGTFSGRVEASISTTVGQPYTISLYLKNKDLSDVTQVWIGFSVASQGQFVTITDEWQRYDITTNADGTTEYPRIQFSGTGSLYAWGFQVEQQSYATSYIPTENNPNGVSRNQDICNNGGSLATINSTEGVLYAEIAALADTITDRHMISISDGTTTNRVYIRFGNASNTIEGRSTIGGLNVGLTSYTVTDETEFHKVAYKWKLNEYSLWIDGTEVSTNTGNVASANTFNTLDFTNGAGGQIAEGKTKCVAVWKEALSDSELQSLTTI
jgi:hypothetical protein